MTFEEFWEDLEEQLEEKPMELETIVRRAYYAGFRRHAELVEEDLDFIKLFPGLF